MVPLSKGLAGHDGLTAWLTSAVLSTSRGIAGLPRWRAFPRWRAAFYHARTSGGNDDGHFLQYISSLVAPGRHGNTSNHIRGRPCFYGCLASGQSCLRVLLRKDGVIQ